MSARDEVLGRIATAHRLAPPPDLPYGSIERAYRSGSSLDAGALVEVLVDRLLDYKALVRRTTPDALAATIAGALRERGVRSVVVPAGVDPAWLSEADAEVVADPAPDGPLPVATLDAADGVLTCCAVAVAATGTLVLDGSGGQGRRVVSLIPDYHLCVVETDQICADVPSAIARLDPVRPTTMISGPSATSDIELNRVEGVHGPRTLEVVLVENVGEAAGERAMGESSA